MSDSSKEPRVDDLMVMNTLSAWLRLIGPILVSQWNQVAIEKGDVVEKVLFFYFREIKLKKGLLVDEAVELSNFDKFHLKLGIFK